MRAAWMREASGNSRWNRLHLVEGSVDGQAMERGRLRIAAPGSAGLPLSGAPVAAMIMMIAVLLLVLWCGLAAAASAASAAGQAVSSEQAGTFAALQRGERVPVFPDSAFARPDQPTVYLSFDDGPSEWTPQVLDILQQEQVPATFFVLGAQAEKRGEVVQRIVREGHALGNHTYNHKYEELYGSFQGFWEQVERTGSILASLTGSEPKLLRAPGGTHGHFDAFYYYYLERAGYLVHDWNVDSGDSRKRNVPAADIIRSVKESALQHEVHVLMHDSSGHGETVKALPEIIGYYKAKGYRFAAYDGTVKPVQYRLAPPRHARSYSATSHQAALALIGGALQRQATETLAGAGGDHGGSGAGASGTRTGSAEERFAAQVKSARTEAAAARHRPAQTLTVRIGEQQAVLQPGDYTVEQGRVTVPLRFLAAQLGAGVRWDDKRRLAYLDYEGITYVMNPETRSVTLERPDGTTEMRVWEELHMRQGAMYVPLRAAAGLLGWTVVSYDADDAGAVLAIGRREPTPRTWLAARTEALGAWLASRPQTAYRHLLQSSASIRSSGWIYPAYANSLWQRLAVAAATGRRLG
ncbi:polysaccharide deacetylase family protein [Paenibacillus sp. 1P07SE]|uniref:polysaccharide deacetylase n=1 Tax=Paenibacillus sp. 1P07SE TaxID=3132209 RepID=UPI0039A55304